MSNKGCDKNLVDGFVVGHYCNSGPTTSGPAGTNSTTTSIRTNTIGIAGETSRIWTSNLI
jgi:hypothetical protein